MNVIFVYKRNTSSVTIGLNLFVSGNEIYATNSKFNKLFVSDKILENTWDHIRTFPEEYDVIPLENGEIPRELFL